ncbi:MAG: hypothetical protein VX859_02190, partial [Pseudomonadota bacterium]|nr:hypothetical protein [Pseudomonadota bacterium]
RIMDKAAIAGVESVGALRLRHFVTKNKPVGDIAELVSNQETEIKPDGLLLDLDCWVWMARR